MNDNQSNNNLVTEKQEEVVSTSTVNNSNGKQVTKTKKRKLPMIIAITVVVLLGVFWVIWPMIKGPTIETKKPIIYIYPKDDINVSIKVNHPEKFSVTYPKYNDGWNVFAKTDGTLIDENGKKYYSLYWESHNSGKNKIKDDGFVVKGKNVSEFLEEKLNVLGLNYKEREEFIIYWLPQLEKNEYNYIRFQTMNEINNNMKLDIKPKPDTLIRVVMEFKPLSKRIDINEQKLRSVHREGYTIVEWGGTRIN